MTSKEWLEKNGKHPYKSELYQDWYWQTYLSYHDKSFSEDEIPESDKHFTLPVVIWNHLQEKTTYPYAKLYKSREDAVEDFHQAYLRAIEGGWAG